jgi:hypothetical protein
MASIQIETKPGTLFADRNKYASTRQLIQK